LFLSTVSWSATGSGLWSTAADWSTGVVPQPGDDVLINEPGNNLQVSLTGSTAVNSIAVTGDTLAVSGGTLSVAASSSIGASGILTLSNATLSVATGATLTNSGSITVNPGSQLNAGSAYSATSTGTLTLPSGTQTTGVETNLLGNPGFEAPSTSGSTTPPSVWGQWGNAYVSTQYAHSGTQSLLESGSNSGVYQSFSVNPNVSYSASVFALTPASAQLTGEQGAFLQIVFVDANGNTIGSPSAWITLLDSNSPAGTWINSTTTLTAPSNAATVSVYLQVGPYTSNSGTAGGSAYLDDVQFGPTAFTSATVSAASLSNSGTITIGAGDTISDSGSFTQSSTGNLTTQLGGPPAGLFFGSLIAGGTATLAGTLKASLVNGYTPSISDGFTILSYASETGSFTTYQLPSGSNYSFKPGVNPTYVGISDLPLNLSTTINAATKVASVTNNLVGVNLAYWDKLLTTTQTQQMVVAAGLSLFRFPGGSSSDDFHFNVSKNDGDSSANTIPQFAQFISEVAGTGIITTDYGSGSPQEAEAELAYLDGSTTDTTTIGTGIEWNDSTSAWQNVNWQTVGYWASLRAAKPLGTNDGLNFLRINQAAPFSNINDWEIGNEEYGSWEVDHHGTAGPGGVSTGAQHDPATYATFAAAFAGFVAGDSKLPAVQIGIDSGDPTGDSDNNWTQSVITDLYADGYVPGFISDHSYMQGPGTESDSFLLNDTVSDSGSNLDWSTRYSDYETMLQQAMGTTKAATVKIMATEYNSNYGVEGKQMTSLVNGLFIADSIGSLMNSGYSGGLVWDLRNGWVTDGNNSSSLYGWREGGDEGILGGSGTNSPPSTGPYIAYPSYFGEQLASKIMQSGGTGVSAVSNYGELTVYSVMEPNGHLDLMVLNKNPDASITDQFNLSGFVPSGATQLWQYGEAQDYAQSQSSTGAAALATSNPTLNLNGNTFSYAFPAYSMTVIDLTPKLSVATAAKATPNPVTGATTALSALGLENGGDTGLTYRWSATGPATVTYSANGNNAAKNSTATFTATGNYTFTVTITDPGGQTTTSMVSVTVNVPTWLGSGSVATWNPSAQTLTVTGATSIIADPNTDEPIVEASGSAAVVTLNPASGTDIHLGGLSLTNGASATVTSLGSARSVSNYRLLVIGTAGATVAPLYTIDSTSTLDLADNDMAILYGSGASPLSTVSSQISQAYDNKLWDKPGLTSSIAKGKSGVTALGFGEASTLGLSTFDGLTLGGNAVLVKYTLAGDANLDGTVNLADYNSVISHLNASGQTWTSGSFDYSGTVSLGNYNTVLANFSQTLANVLPSGNSSSVSPATTTTGSATPTKIRPRGKVVRSSRLAHNRKK